MQLYKIIEGPKIRPDKLHNFMVYKAIKYILSTRELDLKVTRLMEDTELREKVNHFFICTKQIQFISLETALKIAYLWRDITKQYMYTLLVSLGRLADDVNQSNLPFEFITCASQAGNAEAKPPTDPDGLHYLWWEANILGPLKRASQTRGFLAEATVAPKIQKLLQVMEELAENPLGFAVQLWVVESVGVEMSLFLLTLFAKIEIKGQKLFKISQVLSWIAAHIEGDAIDNQEAPYENHRMIPILETITDQTDLFLHAKVYTHCWRDALDELYKLLIITNGPHEGTNYYGRALKGEDSNHDR